MRDLVQSIRDHIFPSYCVGCGLEGSELCLGCREQLSFSGYVACPVCASVEAGGVVCDTCPSALQFVVALGQYEQGSLLAHIIEALKYRLVRPLEREIIDMVRQFVEGRQSILSYPPDMIVAVPLHRRRLAERGYNQSHCLAVAVSQATGVPCMTPLRRHRYTTKQARLGRAGRLDNLVGAFSLVSPESVVGKDILLVDDVYTTGSTMQTCARLLLQAGARSVSGLVLARGQLG